MIGWKDAKVGEQRRDARLEGWITEWTGEWSWPCNLARPSFMQGERERDFFP